MRATTAMSSASRQPKLRCPRAGSRLVSGSITPPSSRRRSGSRLRGGGARDGSGHPEKAGRFGDVVHPQDGSPAHGRGGERGERAGQSLRRGGLLGDAREAPHEALSRGPGGERQADRAKGRKVTKQREVVFR